MLAIVLVPLVFSSAPLAQQSLGMFGEFAREEVYVFDADTDAVLGVLPIVGGFTPCYDCAILAELSLGFVVTANFEVWVIDLTTSPPSLATGTNPIPIGSLGLDVVISLDQKYLLVSGGGALSLSIVDIATRSEVGGYPSIVVPSSVDVAGDRSILMTGVETLAGNDNEVLRLILDAFGNVTDTGESLSLPAFPTNTYFAPNDEYGVVFLRDLVGLQVLMWNPTVFPANPEQSSRRLGVTLWSNGRVTARSTGTRDGMDIELEVVRNPDGTRSVRFPFSIDGF